jgi:hypothetical protein
VNENGQPVRILYTDNFGRFAYPYRGKSETYNFRVEYTQNMGTFLVTGAQGMRPVSAPPP